MKEETSSPARKPRSDVARNRDRLLRAAREVFGSGSAGASLEAVARRAGVGIGTLYRHFPTREALFETVYRYEVDQLAALAETLAKEAGPVEALRQWLQAQVQLVATKKGMLAALALAAHAPADLYAYSFERLTAAIGILLNRAVDAGELRPDISPEEMLRTLIGLCYLHDQPGWQATVVRLVNVFVDGLLVSRAQPLNNGNYKR
ncbi:MAG: TetR/AcrR family transcriptional regulator [Bosea sp. (in: a-proteobacteria)]|uniref:TetR/AcrR family transcriptional regulator n=1 Tax=Bosea sp. (in: a-proteobacteria) TaxID=1871050 RepID=UPI003F7B3FB4